MVQVNFNAQTVAPNATLDPLPTGQYKVIIVASNKEPTSKGDGAFIKLEMEVIEGEFKGRKVVDRLNIENKNQTAVDIAYATLSAICHVTGCIQIQDTQQLHNRPFVAVVRKIKRNDQPELMTNDVAGYKDIYGNDPGFAGNVQQQGGAAGYAPQQPPQQQWAPPQGQAPQQNWQQPPQGRPQYATQPTAPQAPPQAPPGWTPPAQQQAPQQVPQQSQPPAQAPAPAQQPQGAPPGGPAPPWLQGQQG